jgi:hypothetical protein
LEGQSSTRFESTQIHGPKSGWFVHGYELEDDEYPTVRPTLSWAAAEWRLEISAKTRGTIILNTGDDLTIVRTYIAREPQAFPNY